MSLHEYEAVGGAVENALYDILRQRLVTVYPVANPAAGADWTLPVPNVTAWELLAVTGVFTASAVVATRSPSIRVTDQAFNVLHGFPPASTVVAGTAVRFFWEAGYGDHFVIGVGAASLPTPPVLLYPGQTLRASTSSIDVGDQWSSVFVTVREWTPDAVRQQAAWLERNLR